MRSDMHYSKVGKWHMNANRAHLLKVRSMSIRYLNQIYRSYLESIHHIRATHAQIRMSTLRIELFVVPASLAHLKRGVCDRNRHLITLRKIDTRDDEHLNENLCRISLQNLIRIRIDHCLDICLLTLLDDTFASRTSSSTAKSSMIASVPSSGILGTKSAT